MPALEDRLIEYLEPMTGGNPALKDAPDRPGLPLFLRERYEFRRIGLFGRDCLLALERPGMGTGSPAEYAAHSRTMLSLFGEPITLVVPQVVSYARNRMVRAGTPFIVPGSQLFMPFIMVDLRERFPTRSPESGQPLTPAAQFILLYHLLRKPLQGMALQEIAKLTGYTGMTISKVKEELETNGLCKTARAGRSLVIEFTAGGREIWHMAEQLMGSPVKKSHWVHWKAWTKSGTPGLAAGYTALSMVALTEDDPVPTRALPNQDYRTMLANGEFREVGGPEDANVLVQVWTYDPRPLSDSPCVDPLSLVLSLRGDQDDRVQQQLQTVLDRAFPQEP